MLNRAQGIAEQIVAWRRHVHQHPELSYKEYETARFVARALAGTGVPARTGVAGGRIIVRLF